MEAFGSSSEVMPRRWAVSQTVFGPTSRPRRTATVLSDSDSALVSVTGPKYSRL